MLPAPTAPSEGSAGVRNLVKNPKAPTRSRSWLTSSGVASYRTALSEEKPGRSTRLRGPKVRWSFVRPGLLRDRSPRSKPSDALRPFLGRPLLRPALSTEPQTSRGRLEHPPNRVALEEDQLFRRLIPTDSASAPKSFNIACRRRSDLWSPAASACRCRLLERPGPPSRSPDDHAHVRRVAKAKNWVRSLWITGISVTTVGTLSEPRIRAGREAAPQLPFRSRPPTSGKCLNRLH